LSRCGKRWAATRLHLCGVAAGSASRDHRRSC
jgi:hypothetical protein